MTVVRQGWDWKAAVDKARRDIVEQGFPTLGKPTTPLVELGAIEQVEGISSVQLSNMSIRHQAWYSYVTVEYAAAHAELRALEEVLEVKLGEQMYTLGKVQDGRVVKDVLRAVAISQSEELRALVRRKVELEQRDRLLEGLAKGLEIRCRALESESIRRISAQKVEVGR